MNETDSSRIFEDPTSKEQIFEKIPKSFFRGIVETTQTQEQTAQREPYTGIWSDAEVEE